MEQDKSVISIADLYQHMTQERIKRLLTECIKQQHNRLYNKNDHKHTVNITDIIEGHQNHYDELAIPVNNSTNREWTHAYSGDTSAIVCNSSASLLGIRYSQIAKRQDDMIDKLEDVFSPNLKDKTLGKCAVQNWLGSMLFTTLHPYSVARFSTAWLSSMMYVYHAPFDNRYVGAKESLSNYYKLRDQNTARMNCRMLTMAIVNSNSVINSIVQYVLTGDASVNVPTRASLYGNNLATYYNSQGGLSDDDRAANALFLSNIQPNTTLIMNKLREEAFKVADEMQSTNNPIYYGSNNRARLAWIITRSANDDTMLNRYYISDSNCRQAAGSIVTYCYLMNVMDHWEGLLDWLQEMPAQEIREMSVFWTGDNMDNRLNTDTRVSLKRGLIAKPYFVFNSIVNQNHVLSVDNTDARLQTV